MMLVLWCIWVSWLCVVGAVGLSAGLTRRLLEQHTPLHIADSARNRVALLELDHCYC